MIVFGVVGLLVGWLYFHIMHYSLSHLARKRTGVMVFFGLALVRLALFGGGLVAAVQVGPWCLVTYVVGFVVARTVVVRIVRSDGTAPPPKPKEQEKKDEERKAGG